MKPQCETSADCLRELARVMDQFGIGDAILAAASQYVNFEGMRQQYRNTVPAFDMPKDWQFAIAEVEGKPVFIGDELYVNDIKVVISEKDKGFRLNLYSWKQPKHKTVIVEMMVEDADELARTASARLTADYAYDRVGMACKKALENLK